MSDRLHIRHRLGTAGARMLLVLASMVATALPFAAMARGATSGGATATIEIAFKSVTLSTTTLSYGGCTGGYSSGGLLGFPNGVCSTDPVTVTNGNAPATIIVAGTNAVPTDGGKGWTLCGGAGSPSCNPAAAGTDLFGEKDGAVQLGLTGACDLAFTTKPCGAAKPGQSSNETLTLQGPRSSTDQSSSFTTQIIWTAT